MMKKTASALAVAALMGTGAASAATFQINDDTTFSVYGNVQLAYTDINDENGDGVSDVLDNGTTLGVAVEHMFDNGLTGFAKIEEDGFDAAESEQDEQNTDESFFGVRGNFGSVQFGKDDSLYDDAIGDYWDYQEFVVPTSPGGGDTKERDLKYYSPNFGGFSFGLSAQINGDEDEATWDNPAGSGLNEAGDVNGDDAGVSLAAMVQYQAGGLTVVGSVDERANDLVGDDDDYAPGSEGTPNHYDDPVLGLAASYDFGQFSLDAGYQMDQADEAERRVGDIDVFSVGGRFDYGQGNLYGVVQEVGYDEEDANGEDSFTEVVLGVTYDVGSNFYLYGEYGTFDREEDADDGFAIGGLYSF